MRKMEVRLIRFSDKLIGLRGWRFIIRCRQCGLSDIEDHAALVASFIKTQRLSGGRGNPIPWEHGPTMTLVATSLYTPLYNIVDGGPPCAFRCRAKHEFIITYGKGTSIQGDCQKVTRTLRGMLMHLDLCHGIKLQLELPDVKDSSRAQPPETAVGKI